MTGPTRAPATLAADLTRLGEQATPGPWRFTDSEVVDDVWEAGLTVVSADGDAIANVADQWYEGDPGEPAPVNDVAYIVALVNAHRAGHLVTLDAALDWVAEQLADPEVQARIEAEVDSHRYVCAVIQVGPKPDPHCGCSCGKEFPCVRRNFNDHVNLVRARATAAALRDRAASPAQPTEEP